MAIDGNTIDRLKKGLQRIFAMKVGRSTFREVHNTILGELQQDREAADRILKAIATGDTDESGETADKIKELADEYAIPIRLAKEVLERGEFVALLTSDSLNSPQGPLLMNRVRRIDGEEFQFVTDANSTLHFLRHFAGRLADVAKSPGGELLLENIRPDLKKLAQELDSI